MLHRANFDSMGAGRSWRRDRGGRRSGATTAPAAPVKLGIVSFLTGPAASPFGIPGRNGAEIVIEALNAGKAPAPFNTVGFGGTQDRSEIYRRGRLRRQTS